MMNNSLHGSTSSNDGTDDVFINDSPDGMENYVEDILFPMLDEGSLDHAILESLFYNEISLMNSSNISMNEGMTQNENMLSTTSGDADAFLLPTVESGSDNRTSRDADSYLKHQQQHQQSTTFSGSSGIDDSYMFSNLNQETVADPLRNFRVSLANSTTASATSNSNPNSLVGTTLSHDVCLNTNIYPQGVGSSIGIATASSQPLLQHQPALSSPSRKLSVQLPKHTLVTGGGIRHNVVPVLDKNDTESTELPPPTTESTVKISAAPASPTAEEKKRKKLISQFATLAGRLGITLPPQVFQKLSGQATDATPIEAAVNMAPVPDPIPNVSSLLTASSPTDAKPPIIDSNMEKSDHVSNDDQLPSCPPQPVLLQQVQKSAVEAIAAVSNKRSNASTGISTNVDSVDSPMESNKPYSKKRKKPRLSDCEQKLAELQSENMILKRHLDNIANRNARLDEDRMQAEKQMRQMLQDNAPDAILDPIVKNFTDMYSDYGRKRHDELNFHLQQLQRLANPTNFTKMGLWTLGGGGQSSSTSSSDSANGPNGSNGGNNRGNNGSKNPIAGMLQRELGISAQQGRKILDQRQKIQNVCSNLKECLKLLAKLNQLCEKKTQMFHNRMTKCQQVLTPKQVVKLLIWIDDNSQTLGTVCPGWGSEQFQSKTTKANKDTVPK